MRNLQAPPPIRLKFAKEGCNSSSNKKGNTLKLEIKMQLGDSNSETVSLTVKIFKNRPPEDLLKFKTKLANFFQGTDPVNRTSPECDDQEPPLGRGTKDFQN